MTISVSPTFVITIQRADMTLIQTTPTEIRQLNSNTFRMWLHDWADSPDGMGMPFPFRHNTEVIIDGLAYARSIEILPPYTVTFEDGAYQVNIVGSNNNIHSRRNLNSVSIVPSNSAGLIGLQSISDNSEYASFAGGVTIDTTNGYPMNTPGKLVGSQIAPVNNAAEAKLIATDRGLTKLFIVGSLTLSGSDFDYFDIHGRNTFLTVSGINHARFYDCMVSGSVGRDCRFTDSALGSITATAGYMHLMHCGLAGPVYLSACTAIVQECSSAVSGENDTIFDFTNTASGLEARSFTGAMKLRNKNGAQAITIDMAGGQVTIDSTVSNGAILLRGTASAYDNSTGTAIVKTHGLMNPINVTATTNKMIEGLRPHHRGYGNIWYFDPNNGNDANDGRTPTTAFLTFAATHAAVRDFGHDVILIVPKGDGPTISNEPMTITKNFLFIRGMGYNAHIHPTTTTAGGNLIEVSGNGVEISGIHLEGINIVAANCNGIVCTGANILLEDLTVEECTGHGVVMTTPIGHDDRGTIKRCHIRMNGKSGMQYNQGNHMEVTDTDFEENGQHGVDLTGAAATEDPVFHHCNFLRNTGYGLKINNATVVGATIESECEFAFNGSGDYINNGTDTIFQEATSNTATAAAVWAKAVEGLTAEQMLRVMLSALAGKRSGIGTATETYYGQDAVTPRITLTPDVNGNGLPTINGAP